MGCPYFLQGNFPTQGSNPGLPHCRQTLYRLSHKGSLWLIFSQFKCVSCTVNTTQQNEFYNIQLSAGKLTPQIIHKQVNNFSTRDCSLHLSVAKFSMWKLSPLNFSKTFQCLTSCSILHFPLCSGYFGLLQMLLWVYSKYLKQIVRANILIIILVSLKNVTSVQVFLLQKSRRPWAMKPGSLHNISTRICSVPKL